MPTTTDRLPAPLREGTGWPWQAESSSEPSADGPLISIVTPSFNQAEFIEETIRSVLLQDYHHIELIVIDGGSTDGSAEIIERYAPWLAYWVSERDRGQSHALQKGFARASGEVIGWLNSDDRFRPGALSDVARLFRENPKAGLVHGKTAFCDEGGVLTGVEVGSPLDMTRMLRGDNCIAQPSALMSREAFHRCGGLNEDLHFVMDMDLWIRLGLNGEETVFENRVWSDFRYHAGSKTTREQRGFAEEILGVVSGVVDDGRLPPELDDRAARLVGEVLELVAAARYAEGDDAAARQAVLRAMRRDPTGALSGRYVSTLVRTLLGRDLVARLRRRNRQRVDGPR